MAGSVRKALGEVFSSMRGLMVRVADGQDLEPSEFSDLKRMTNFVDRQFKGTGMEDGLVLMMCEEIRRCGLFDKPYRRPATVARIIAEIDRLR